MSFTVVAFHAHPDDEALLTAGTLARAAADGHRVVVVVATRGEAGLTVPEMRENLAERRMAELRASARALGVASVVELGYGDSGMDGRAVGERPAFASAPVAEAAARLAEILRAERADVLTTYDAAGGYGHPDHVQVHRVGVEAARLAGTPVVLEATVDRALLQRALWLISWFPKLPEGFSPRAWDRRFSARADITHAVDVRRHSRQKRAAMAAHASQAAGGPLERTVAFCLRVPPPLYRRVFGREWFIERGRTPGRPPLDDIFASLR